MVGMARKKVNSAARALVAAKQHGADDSRARARYAGNECGGLSAADNDGDSASEDGKDLTQIYAFRLGGGTDNASYSVAATFDTVPMADQTGRIAVTPEVGGLHHRYDRRAA